jgi:protein-disulfide isomerase
VYIDYPMLGPESTFAAKAALASMQQQKYIEFHNAMMQSKKPLTETQVYKLAAASGINIKELKSDIGNKNNLQALVNNLMLGNAFGIVGLPTFIIGYTQSPHDTQVYPGIDPSQLDALIEKAEKTRSNNG